VTVDQAGDLRQTLTRNGIKTEQLEEFAILNGMYLQDQLQRGDLIKVVR
jgi:predicted Zn-dependent protease